MSIQINVAICTRPHRTKRRQFWLHLSRWWMLMVKMPELEMWNSYHFLHIASSPIRFPCMITNKNINQCIKTYFVYNSHKLILQKCIISLKLFQQDSYLIHAHDCHVVLVLHQKRHGHFIVCGDVPVMWGNRLGSKQRVPRIVRFISSMGHDVGFHRKCIQRRICFIDEIHIMRNLMAVHWLYPLCC